MIARGADGSLAVDALHVLSAGLATPRPPPAGGKGKAGAGTMRSLEMQFADVEIGKPWEGKNLDPGREEALSLTGGRRRMAEAGGMKPAGAEPVHSQELGHATVEVAEPPAGQSLGLVLVPAAAGAALGAGLSYAAFRRQRRQLAQALYQQ